MALQLDQDLQTPYVFIDTEGFIRAQYDWDGRILSKLVEFAKQGNLRLLTTDITKREVYVHLREHLIEATNAVKKYRIVLGQVQNSDIIATLSDAEAFTKLKQSFEPFLCATQAIDVPTAISLEDLFADYFALRPPFSNRKKSEFPDAVVIASLRAWCAKRNTNAYVVSGDPDLKHCCSASGPLLYAASIEEIISRATVSQELHDALQHALSENELLIEWLAEKVGRLTVVRGDLRLRHLSGVVNDVYDVNVYSLSVLERDGTRLTCEIEFEAGLDLRLSVQERERFGYEDDNYQPARSCRTKSIYRVFSAEVVVKFDPQIPEEIELESVYVDKDSIELDTDDVMGR